MAKATQLQNTYNKIVSFDNYTPSTEVNEAFSDLVKIALSETENKLTKNETIKLQKTCSQAEYELEKYWTNKIIQDTNPTSILKKFPYLDNYEKLTQLEWFSLLSCTKHITHKFLFIGSGPLPLTAIILATNYLKEIAILDISPEACNLSEKLIQKLKLDDKIRVINHDAATFKGYSKYNVIVVAALAGTNSKTKTEILKKIKLSAPKNTHILARSSYGAREMLYKPLDSNIYKIFSPLVEVRPQNEVVNSVVIFQNV